MHAIHARDSRWLGAALWTVQLVLALLFLFAGASKLAMPIEELTRQSSLPGLLLRFIGLCETLGAVGLLAASVACGRTAR